MAEWTPLSKAEYFGQIKTFFLRFYYFLIKKEWWKNVKIKWNDDERFLLMKCEKLIFCVFLFFTRSRFRISGTWNGRCVCISKNERKMPPRPSSARFSIWSWRPRLANVQKRWTINHSSSSRRDGHAWNIALNKQYPPVNVNVKDAGGQQVAIRLRRQMRSVSQDGALVDPQTPFQLALAKEWDCWEKTKQENKTIKSMTSPDLLQLSCF